MRAEKWVFDMLLSVVVLRRVSSLFYLCSKQAPVLLALRCDMSNAKPEERKQGAFSVLAKRVSGCVAPYLKLGEHAKLITFPPRLLCVCKTTAKSSLARLRKRNCNGNFGREFPLWRLGFGLRNDKPTSHPFLKGPARCPKTIYAASKNKVVPFSNGHAVFKTWSLKTTLWMLFTAAACKKAKNFFGSSEAQRRKEQC